MTVPAKIAVLFVILFAMSFPLAADNEWGEVPSIIVGIALLAMLSLTGWRRWRHD